MTAPRKKADVREKEMRLAISRIERGRSHTKAAKLSISAVAREVGVSPSLLHNHYPALAEEIRTKQGASSRKKLEAKHDDLGLEREKVRRLRQEIDELKTQLAKLASINEMQAMENRVLAARCSSIKVASFPSIRATGALASTPGE